MKRLLILFIILIASQSFAQPDTWHKYLKRNGLVYAMNRERVTSLDTGVTGQLLQSNGNLPPTWVNASIGSLGGWSTTGNTGTNSSVNFIGTLDTAALTFHVDASEGRYFGMQFDQGSNLTIGGLYGGNRNIIRNGLCLTIGANNQTDSNASEDLMVGTNNLIYSPWSAAIGQYNETHKDNSLALGASCKARGYTSIATGYWTEAGIASFSCGQGIHVGNYSFGFAGGTGGGAYGVNNSADFLTGEPDLTPLPHTFSVIGASVVVSQLNGFGGDLRFYPPHGLHDFGTAKYTSFSAGALSANVTYTLPTAQGVAGSVMTNNGSGALSWSATGVVTSYRWFFLEGGAPHQTENDHVYPPVVDGLHDYVLLDSVPQKILGASLYTSTLNFPRNLEFGFQHGVDSIDYVLPIEIYGKNVLNAIVHETVIFTTSDTIRGIYAFSRIDSIILPVRINGGGDYLSIGYDDALGLPYKLSRDTQLHGYADNVKESSDCILTFDPDYIERNTVRFPTRSNNTSRRFDFYLTQ